MNLNRFLKYTETPDFGRFARAFQKLLARASTDQAREELANVGGQAFERFVTSTPVPEPAVLRWFVDHAKTGRIQVSRKTHERLQVVEARANAEARRRQSAAALESGALGYTRRIAQLTWFGHAGFQASDVRGARQSAFRSPQERTFYRAAAVRFPGLLVLPNYPIDQVVDLGRLGIQFSPEMISYARAARLDTVLVTPIEGDPVAAFELDSALHREESAKRRDRWKDEILSFARIPLFRLESEDPTATTADEWYAILTDQVLDKIDVGNRLRTRDVHTFLAPI